MAGTPLFKFAMVALAFLALTAAWQLTPLADYAEPETVKATFDGFRTSNWALLVVPAIFVAGGLIAFPLVIMIAATAAVFGPFYGTLYSMIGALLSALATYAVGYFLGRKALRNALGSKIEGIRKRVRKQGVLAVMAIRLVPIAPFTMVNVAMGASEIRVLDYLAGTLLGLAPGLIALAALGDAVMRMLANPTLYEVGLLAGAVILWIAISLGVQYAVSKMPGGGR